jgi:hypothetical protein
MKALRKIGVAMMIALAFASCGSSKQGTKQSNNASKNPFGEVYATPCEIYDTDEEFTATGIYRGSSNQKGEVQNYALQNAQQRVRMKIQHAYKGMVSNFSQSIGNNQGNDIEAKVSMAGDQIIDAFINNTRESCLRWGEVGDDGHIECYVAIKISKAKLADAISKAVDNKLTDDEKMKISFDEKVYREQMEKRFQEYKESK